MSEICLTRINPPEVAKTEGELNSSHLRNMTNNDMLFVFSALMNMHVAPRVTEFGVGTPKSMLNNGITSLTRIHRKAGIKHSTEGGKKKKRKRRKRIEMENEAIKKQICCLSIEKMKASGKSGEPVVEGRGEREEGGDGS